MANEATLIFETSLPIPFTCDNATGIEKGTILQLTSPMTVSASSADNQTFAGIAAEEKIANDGKTTIGVYVSGVFLVTDSGAGIGVGDFAKIAGANLVATADDAGVQGANEIVGKMLETVGAGETGYCLVGHQ